MTDKLFQDWYCVCREAVYKQSYNNINADYEKDFFFLSQHIPELKFYYYYYQHNLGLKHETPELI